MSEALNIRPERRGELDALRGVAAVCVVAYHALALHPPSREAMWALFCSPLYPLATGRPAVILFFVLSGFVLHGALSAERRATGRVDIGAFALKRFCRIWPPFAAAGLLAAAVAAAASVFATLPAQLLPAPMRGWPEDGYGLAALARHLTLDGIERHLALNSVSWSLVYELRVALLLPVLSILIVRARGATLAVGVGLAILADVALSASAQESLAERNYQAFGDIGLSLLGTVYCLPMFLLGAATSESLRRSELGIERLGPRGALCVFALAWGLMWFPNDALVAVGAATLVALAARAVPARSALNRAAPLFFGRISYSLYLVHLPWLYGAVLILGGVIGVGPAIVFGLASLPPVALLFRICVELPSQQIGRGLGRRLSERRRASSPEPV